MAEVEEIPRFIDLKKGTTHKHKVPYSWLSKYTKDKIEELDLTVHELFELAITEVRIGNLHLLKLSGQEITEKDVEWP